MFDIQEHYVPTGTYYIDGTKSLILKACLGTCVGVTLCDRDAGIGGLVHLLLPEPMLSEGALFPDKYASECLPLFINALCEAGASRDRLKASIAGGALIGPVNKLDLDLDIGGRTSDVVLRILAEEEIEVEKFEVGGFFTCCLCLNMQNWESDIEPAWHERIDADGDMNISSQTKKEIYDTMERLLPIPQVALKILRIMDEDDYNISEIADAVQQDQVISARTLQICNSAIFARKKKVESIDHALVFLGKNFLVRMILSSAIGGFFDQCSMGYSLCKGGLFHHAVGTAIVAEILAQFTGKASPFLVYTAGLLHDIGKVVLDQHVSSTFPFFYRGIQEGNDFLEIEQEVFGVDHTEVGARLARKWYFSDTLDEAIKHHHHPEKADLNPELTDIVSMDDLLMSKFYADLELECLNPDDLSLRLERIGLSTHQFADIADLVPNQVLGPFD